MKMLAQPKFLIIDDVGYLGLVQRRSATEECRVG
jgi:hypothetical protein